MGWIDRGKTERLVLTLLFVLTALVFRLPQLTSGQVALDGDEAIVALMAGDALDGHGVPIFFYGQHYGLALLEAIPVAGAFHVFGNDPIVVKGTMLALWILGGCFTVHAAVRLGGPTAGAFVGLVLASMPAWVPWSMKARGGYCTAFWASQIALWVLAGFIERRFRIIQPASLAGAGGVGGVEGARGRDFAGGGEGAGRWPGASASGLGDGPSFLDPPLGGAAPKPGLRAPLEGLLLGVMLAVTAFAQPLFLLPLLPYFIYLRPWPAWIGLFAGAGAVAAPLVMRLGTNDAVWAPRILGFLDPDTILVLPFRVTTALSGYYYYLYSGEPPDLVVWGGRVLAAAGFLAVVYALASRVRDDVTDGLWASAVGTLTFLLATLWIRPDQFAFRYFLPMAAPIAMLLGLAAGRWASGRFGRVLVFVTSAVLFGFAAASAWAGRDLSLAVEPGTERGSETEATRALVEHLRERGIGNAYVLDPMYQWNLILASDREIRARWQDPVDRVPDISRAVDAAFAAGEPTAIVGDARFAERLREALDKSGWTELRMDVIENRHFVLESPPRTLLDALDFRFEE
ncbi:MAG: hypothetical protein R3E97_13590 [Candidatus Eisenbacteria bacterium]